MDYERNQAYNLPQRLFNQAIRLRSVYYETAYKKCKNKITNLIRTSKENYSKAKLSDSKNSKESWQFINELLNKNSKTSQIREINFDGKAATKDEEIAAGLNEYFSTIGSMLSKAIKDCDTDPLRWLDSQNFRKKYLFCKYKILHVGPLYFCLKNVLFG